MPNFLEIANALLPALQQGFAPQQAPVNTGIQSMSGYGNPVPSFGMPTPDVNARPMNFGRNDMGPNIGDMPSAMDRYRDAILDFPTYQRPSVMRMIGTGLLSALQRTPDQVQERIDEQGNRSYTINRGHWDPYDIKEADAILQMPNQRRMEEWKLRTGALKEAANIESQDYQRRINADVANRREGRLLDQGQQSLAIRNRLADTREWLAKNPKGILNVDDQGMLVLIDPIDGSVINTGVHSSQMPQRERMELMNKHRMQQIQQQGQNQLANTAAIGQNQQRNIEANTQGQIQIKQTPGANSQQERTLLPTQQVKQMQLRMTQGIQNNPKWNDWMSIDANGMVQIEAPANHWWESGPTQQEYSDMVSWMRGETPAKGQGGSTTQGMVIPPKVNPPPLSNKPVNAEPIGGRNQGQNKQQPIYQRNKATGQVRVSYDGGKTWQMVKQ